LIFSIAAKAQQPSIKSLDINLENYQYPYPVQYIGQLDRTAIGKNLVSDEVKKTWIIILH
jgi:hypothetical protein